MPWEMARKVEGATRDQSSSKEWHKFRKPLIISSHFRAVFHVCSPDLEVRLADGIMQGNIQMAAMKRGQAMKPLAIREYCRAKNKNYSPLGFVDHPGAPELRSSTDGLIYDPTERPPSASRRLNVQTPKAPFDCTYLKKR